MLNVSIICVGKLKESYWREACAEYSKRLGAFCRISVIEVEEERLPEAPSPAQIDSCLRAEGKRLLARVPSGAALWAAMQLARRPQFCDKIVVALLPDTGERYLSTGLFAPGE